MVSKIWPGNVKSRGRVYVSRNVYSVKFGTMMYGIASMNKYIVQLILGRNCASVVKWPGIYSFAEHDGLHFLVTTGISLAQADFFNPCGYLQTDQMAYCGTAKAAFASLI